MRLPHVLGRRALIALPAALGCIALHQGAAHAIEVMPVIGLGTPTGRGSQNFGYGLHLAFSFGGRVHERVSLHGQVHGHMLNFDNVPPGHDVGGGMPLFTFAALFHPLPSHLKVDILAGPTFGMFGSFQGGSGGVDWNSQTYGIHLGLAIAAFYRLNPTAAVGPYLHYTRLFAQRACREVEGVQVCDGDPDNADEGFFSLGLGMTF